MHSLLVISGFSTTVRSERQSVPPANSLLPVDVLQSNGYMVAYTDHAEQAKRLVLDADAVILHVPIGAVKSWGALLAADKRTPIVWWCDESSAMPSLEDCEDDVAIDGILTPSMRGYEVHWALHLSAKQAVERRQWECERQQLLGRIEERQWIDKAKGVLCEIRQITESEAYHFLRKQAMLERKRMVDVAVHLVSVYETLQGNKRREVQLG